MTRAFVESIEPRLMLARAVGIDVAHYQGTIDWASVASAVSFAMIKATGSDDGNYTDSKFSTNASGAKAAGVKFGVYHFAYPNTANTTAATILADAKSEADFFLSVAKSRMGPGYLPPMLDMERAGGTMSVANLSLWCNDFNQEIYSTVGVKPFIYCNSNYAENYLNTTVSQWPLWIAAYPGSSANRDTYQPGVGNSTHGWTAGTWKFWQYTDDLPTSGITTEDPDGDVFNGTVADFNNYFASLSGPTVTVANGATSITNGQTTPISFGTTPQNASGYILRFTVTNSGANTVTTSNFAVPAGYVVTDPLATSIASGASDTFILQQNTATVGTFAGNVSFSTTDSTTPSFKFAITGTIKDVTPPTIASGNFNYASTTPSLSFTFSEDVGSTAAASDFAVVNDTTGQTFTPSSFAYDASTHVATLTWNSALTNGNYTASIAAGAVADVAGNAMTMGYTFGFFSLAGDVNRDRKVDIGDLGILSTNWQVTSATWAMGDLDSSGRVDIGDLGILSTNWQVHLPTPGTPDGLTSTAGAAIPAKAVKTTVIATTAVPPTTVAKKVALASVSSSILN